MTDEEVKKLLRLINKFFEEYANDCPPKEEYTIDMFIYDLEQSLD